MEHVSFLRSEYLPTTKRDFGCGHLATIGYTSLRKGDGTLKFAQYFRASGLISGTDLDMSGRPVGPDFGTWNTGVKCVLVNTPGGTSSSEQADP